MNAEPNDGLNWSDEDWQDLLSDIQKGAVIPIVGEELYTQTGADGADQPLYSIMAQRLATRFKVELPSIAESGRPLNDFMCGYLRGREQRGKQPEMDRVYDEFCILFNELNPQPPAVLKSLAEIRNFKLLVTTSPDDLLERALDEVRFGGKRVTSPITFMLKPPYQDLPAEYDPARAGSSEPPAVYHLFGRLRMRLPDQFVISDEDLLEFFLAIQSLRKEDLPNLRDALEANHLLFLGGSLSDWLVRFLLRTMSRNNRLSKRPYYDVLVAPAATRESGLIKFLKFFSPRAKVVQMGPREFVAGLHRRWKAANPANGVDAATESPVFIPPRPRMLENSVFISYASEDRDLVRKFKARLDQAGIEVWFDLDQLMVGHNWELEIQNNLNACSFFIPIISKTTQQIRFNAFFRKEWNSAEKIAERSDAAVEFILPVLLDHIPESELAVPEVFKRHQSVLAPDGIPPGDFVERLKHLVEERKLNPVRRRP